MSTSPKAILFDLDSTLCQYTLTVAEVIERALSRAGLAHDVLGPLDTLAKDYNDAWWATEDEYRTHVDEIRRLAWVALLETREAGDSDLARRLAQHYSDIRRESGLRLFEDVRPFLEDLKARYRVGILTNGPSDMQWTKLRNLELLDAVDAIVVAGDLGFFKPDPRPFRQLLEKLGAEAGDALFVGDSYEHDIIGARGVGIRTAWVTADGASTPDGAPVDHTVARVTDLREVLL